MEANCLITKNMSPSVNKSVKKATGRSKTHLIQLGMVARTNFDLESVCGIAGDGYLAMFSRSNI
jgi:hypothetical protein